MDGEDYLNWHDEPTCECNEKQRAKYHIKVDFIEICTWYHVVYCYKCKCVDDCKHAQAVFRLLDDLEPKYDAFGWDDIPKEVIEKEVKKKLKEIEHASN